MLEENEYHPYFNTYIEPLLERNQSLLELMENSAQEMVELLLSVNEEKGNFRYAEGKWSVKQLIQHIIDTERIFIYRALRIARGDQSDLLGFDHDRFVENAETSHRSLQEMIDEFVAVRQSAINLFNSFSNEALLSVGKASGNSISVRALGYLVSGHQLHHQRILVERYL